MPVQNIESILKKLSHRPGVYLYKNEAGEVIYVGKAKDLKKRVSSYFRKMKDRPMRTQKMLEKAANLEWIEAASEFEALVLETNFIKNHRPRYNVLMKDDKYFIYIKITRNEDYPRVLLTRRIENDGARYFGPKSSAGAARRTLTLLQKLFMLRSCDLNIEWDDGEAVVTKKTMAYPCLDFHIKRCAGPCIGKVTPDEYYKQSIQNIEWFLEGKTAAIEGNLKDQMTEAVAKKAFEKAAQLRDKLQSIEDLKLSANTTFMELDSADAIGVFLDQGKAYFAIFMVRESRVVRSENFLMQIPEGDALNSDFMNEVLSSFLIQFYSESSEIPELILLPQLLDEHELLKQFLSERASHRVDLNFPQRGPRSELIQMAHKNAINFQKQSQIKFLKDPNGPEDRMEDLARVLELKKVPRRMEAYDISHFGGEGTVASMVVFLNGESAPKEYRHFHLRSLPEGQIDDFASMKEVLSRRLAHLSRPSKIWKVKVREGICELLKSKEVQAQFAWKLTSEIPRLAEISDLEVKGDLPFSVAKWWISEFFKKEKLKRVYAQRVFTEHIALLDMGFTELKNKPDFLAFSGVTIQSGAFNSSPDLILIDGGKGQLSMAQLAMTELGFEIPMIGLAKKREEIFMPGAKKPIILPKSSPGLKLCQSIRDEAHRFAITFQRKGRKLE